MLIHLLLTGMILYYKKSTSNVGKYTNLMDPMGILDPYKMGPEPNYKWSQKWAPMNNRL